MSQNGFSNLFNYIDDLIYSGLPSDIHSSFQFLKDLLAELGLDISLKKLVPPSTSVVCLGIPVDSITKIVSIPKDKLLEIVQLCSKWSTKTYCGKQDLRDNVQSRKILITPEFRKDQVAGPLQTKAGAFFGHRFVAKNC